MHQHTLKTRSITLQIENMIDNGADPADVMTHIVFWLTAGRESQIGDMMSQVLAMYAFALDNTDRAVIEAEIDKTAAEAKMLLDRAVGPGLRPEGKYLSFLRPSMQNGRNRNE